jgi:hypothetical protein
VVRFTLGLIVGFYAGFLGLMAFDDWLAEWPT